MKGKILFEETQSFTGTFMWYIILISEGIALIGISINLFLNPIDSTGIIGLVIVFSIMIGVFVLLTVSKLEVQIDEQAIYYRYPPFIRHEKKLSKTDIASLHIRKYRPIWEYGGYGFRYRPKSGRAFNISGNIGLQLVLTNGKKILIGTQKKESMQIAVNRLKENWEMNG